MQQYVIRRIVLMIPTIIAVTIIVAGLLRIMPGDALMAQMQEARGTLDDATLARYRAEMGIDRPFPVQYAEWVTGVVTGDWGLSFWQNRPVLTVIGDRLPASVQLGVMAVIIGILISVPIGILSAVKQDTPIDYLGRTIAIFGISVPNFFLALLVIIYGARWLGWFPPQSYQNPFESPMGNMEQFLPAAIVLGAALAGQNMRMLRTTMLETMRADYVRTARAKGLKELSVIYRHAFRNALIPVITLLGFQISVVIGGSVIIETVFSIPGVGRTYIEAVHQRDYPLVQGIMFILIVATLVSNLLVDLSYSVLDPRIRYS